MRLLAGDPERRADFVRAFEALDLDGSAVVWLRDRTERRRVARSALPDGTPCLVKHFLRPRRHRAREAFKRVAHLEGSRREWRALQRLHAAGVRVPRPLALLRSERGEDALLMEWLEALPLDASLEVPRAERGPRLAAVGALVRSLHDAGWVHRDLNAGNLLWAADGPALVDVGAVARRRNTRARHRDLGHLEHSLEGKLSLSDRIRLRASCLGLEAPFGAAAREALRDVGRAARERRSEHLASRAKRSLRPGRRSRTLRAAGGVGLIARSAEPSWVEAAVAGEPLPADLQWRVFQDGWPAAWRGSSARRAWHRCHALEALALPHPEALALLEWHRGGCPAASALLQRIAPEAPQPELPDRVEAWARLWARLHDGGFQTPTPEPDALRFTLRNGHLEAELTAPENLGAPTLELSQAPLQGSEGLDAAWRALGADEALCRIGRAIYTRTRGCAPTNVR